MNMDDERQRSIGAKIGRLGGSSLPMSQISCFGAP